MAEMCPPVGNITLDRATFDQRLVGPGRTAIGQQEYKPYRVTCVTRPMYRMSRTRGSVARHNE